VRIVPFGENIFIINRQQGGQVSSSLRSVLEPIQSVWVGSSSRIKWKFYCLSLCVCMHLLSRNDSKIKRAGLTWAWNQAEWNVNKVKMFTTPQLNKETGARWGWEGEWKMWLKFCKENKDSLFYWKPEEVEFLWNIWHASSHSSSESIQVVK